MKFAYSLPVEDNASATFHSGAWEIIEADDDDVNEYDEDEEDESRVATPSNQPRLNWF